MPAERPPRTLPPARWYELRRAASTKPATYTCPICRGYLPALTEHVLIRPEGTGDHRRHAHTPCVAQARAEGLLPSRAEWLATQPRQPSWWRRFTSRA